MKRRPEKSKDEMKEAGERLTKAIKAKYSGKNWLKQFVTDVENHEGGEKAATSPAMILNYRNGKNLVDGETAKVYAEILGVTKEYLRVEPPRYGSSEYGQSIEKQMRKHLDYVITGTKENMKTMLGLLGLLGCHVRFNLYDNSGTSQNKIGDYLAIDRFVSGHYMFSDSRSGSGSETIQEDKVISFIAFPRKGIKLHGSVFKLKHVTVELPDNDLSMIPLSPAGFYRFMMDMQSSINDRLYSWRKMACYDYKDQKPLIAWSEDNEYEAGDEIHIDFEHQSAALAPDRGEKR